MPRDEVRHPPIAPSEIVGSSGHPELQLDIVLDNTPYEVGLGWTVDEDKKWTISAKRRSAESRRRA